MTKIVVFDSGLGSLSIIRSIQKYTKCETIYLADTQSYPYGEKSRSELFKIIKNTILLVQARFDPDYIIMGSNTPTLLLDLESPRVFGVRPPVKLACQTSKTKSIAILATRSVTRSKTLADILSKTPKNITVHKINCSDLVDLVESGDFLDKPGKSKKIIRTVLFDTFKKHDIDTATLSSTHLPFLHSYLTEQFPDVVFLDPADHIAECIAKKFKPASRNTLKIFTTDNSAVFEKNLRRLGIKNKIHVF